MCTFQYVLYFWLDFVSPLKQKSWLHPCPLPIYCWKLLKYISTVFLKESLSFSQYEQHCRSSQSKHSDEMNRQITHFNFRNFGAHSLLNGVDGHKIHVLFPSKTIPKYIRWKSKALRSTTSVVQNVNGNTISTNTLSIHIAQLVPNAVIESLMNLLIEHFERIFHGLGNSYVKRRKPWYIIRFRFNRSTSGTVIVPSSIVIINIRLIIINQHSKLHINRWACLATERQLPAFANILPGLLRNPSAEISWLTIQNAFFNES